MYRLMILLTVLLFGAGQSDAAVPSQITVQGKLSDSSGTPLPAGTKTFVFRIFNAQNAGTELWPGGAGESQVIPSDAAGLWSANLGSQIALPTSVFAASDAWMQVTVNDGQAITTLPRTRLVTAPYAHRVATVDGATGGTIVSGGIDMPYSGSTLDNNTTGIRWLQGNNMQTAFGLLVYYGLHFQGAYDGINSQFGVRAPTTDGTLGPIVFSVSPGGNIWTQSSVTAQGAVNAQSLTTTYNINAGGNIYSNAGIICEYNVSCGGGVYADNSISAGGTVSGASGYFTGNVCALNVSCPSDARLKDKIESLPDALESVAGLRGVRYEWRRDEFPDRKFAPGQQVGLIAQEVQQIVPQAVQEMQDGYLAVDYARLVPLLIEGMKEQQEIINRQNERITNLEKKLEQ